MNFSIFLGVVLISNAKIKQLHINKNCNNHQSRIENTITKPLGIIQLDCVIWESLLIIFCQHQITFPRVEMDLEKDL